MAVEVMSLGVLSRMFVGLNKNDQKQISKKYNLNHKVLCSWLHVLTYVRNICAHHGRLWDRILSIKIILPKQAQWQHVNQSNITSIIYLILDLFSKINLEKHQVTSWCNRYIELVSQPLDGLETNNKLLGLRELQVSNLWAQYTNK